MGKALTTVRCRLSLLYPDHARGPLLCILVMARGTWLLLSARPMVELCVPLTRMSLRLIGAARFSVSRETRPREGRLRIGLLDIADCNLPRR